MRPVFQTIIDKDRGNCLTACLASLLHREIHEVPNFAALSHEDEVAGEPDSFWERLYAWLLQEGYSYVSIHGTDSIDYRGMLGQYCILTVPSQGIPGGHHAVVGQFVPGDLPSSTRLAVAHDPNPNNQPYADDIEPSFVCFLTPRLPR